MARYLGTTSTMAPAPTVSVVIPTIGRGEVLIRTLQAILEQGEALEVIVVDQTPRHPPQVAAQLKRWAAEGTIRWIFQAAPSAAKARNEGIRASQGEVILFMDDDVEIFPHLVARHSMRYMHSDITFVCGHIRPPTGIVRLSRHPLSFARRIGWMFFPLNSLKPAALAAGGSGNLSVRAAAARSVGGMDEQFERGAHREEADFCLRLVMRGAKGVFEPAAAVRSLVCPVGGIRTWREPVATPGLNHAVGEWYFTIRHWDPLAWPVQIAAALVRQVIGPSTRTPLAAPVALTQSVAGLLIAIGKIASGRKTRSEW